MSCFTSKTPCHNRIKRLEAEGFITGYRVLLDPVKMNLSHVAFVEVKLNSTRTSALREFNQAVRRYPEIEQCHMLAASYDYLLKVRGSDIVTFGEFLGETFASASLVKSKDHLWLAAMGHQPPSRPSLGIFLRLVRRNHSRSSR